MRLLGRSLLRLSFAALLGCTTGVSACAAQETLLDTRTLSDIGPEEFENWPACAVASGWKLPRIAKNIIPRKMARNFSGLDGKPSIAYGRRFLVRAYDEATARAVCGLAERQYANVLASLGLSRPEQQSGLYPITVYRSREEYLRKTPNAGRSWALTAGNAVYLYAASALRHTVAHEVTHVVLHEDFGASLRHYVWAEEGLASAMEREAMPSWEREWNERSLLAVAENPRPMQKLWSPLSVEDETFERWHKQALCLVSFMLRSGGKENLVFFIKTMSEGWHRAVAFRFSYFDIWESFADLERSWLAEGRKPESIKTAFLSK